MRKPGRPSLYTPELAAKICERLADGESLRAICKEEGWPDANTVRRWLIEHEAFRAQYASARTDQAEGYAAEIVEIADTDKDPQRARVRVDARKWVASKLLPKVYGEKLAHEVTGAAGGPIVIKTTIPSSDEPDAGT